MCLVFLNPSSSLHSCWFNYKEAFLANLNYTPEVWNLKKKLEKEIPFGNHHFQIPCETLITLEVYVRLSLQNPLFFWCSFCQLLKVGHTCHLPQILGQKFQEASPPILPSSWIRVRPNQVLLGSPGRGRSLATLSSLPILRVKSKDVHLFFSQGDFVPTQKKNEFNYNPNIHYL